MSKYLPLNLKWRFTTKHGFVQWRSLLWRIYINIFGMFLRIPVLPMGFSWRWKTFDIWYKGETLVCFWKKGKLKYQSLSSCGQFNSLAEVDKFWYSYFKECDKIEEKKLDFPT